MGKLLLLILGLFLAYVVLQSYRKRVGRQEPRTLREQEDMVRCEHCGVHLPRSESLLASGKFYCSVEHQPRQQKPE
ncbi:MAG TPA: PP0621 family protein [Burkholderiales bacterium]|nr:PP0621 family protein [Burkholderiales bacterium]